MRKGCLFATGLLLWTFGWVVHAASVPLTVDIYPRHQLAASAATVRVRFIVERDERNRVLAWSYESLGQSGTSQRQLDGADSPRVYTEWLKDLPPGDYHLIAVVFRNDHSQVIRAADFSILGLE